MKENNYKVFVHLETEDNSIIENQEDKDYLLSKELIIEKDSKFYTDFVGEVRTPNSTYFSLPKNFENNPENIKLTQDLLNYFETVKNPKWETLLYNKYFEPKVEGEFESEKFYFNELKSFFLDYITYEFIYPLNKLKIHSGSPIKGGKLDILSTVQNRKRFGTGMTYFVKDIKNTDEWMIDDIYYHTLDMLANKLGTESDKRDIEEMKKYLDNEGYEILLDDSSNPTTFNEKFPDMSNADIIEAIHKSQVGSIHYPIRDTLLEFYEGRKLKESSYKIRVFYTTNFQKVWEELAKSALYHNSEFEKEMYSEYNFTKIETISKWYPSEELETKLSELSSKGAKISGDNSNIIEWRERSLEPDIFSYFDKGPNIKSFVGDAKYYNDVNSDFGKEMNDYNEAIQNKYPMCIFCCSEETTVHRKRRSGDKELIIFILSTRECIDVALKRLSNKEDFSLLFKIHRLINKYTSRKGPEFKGGFLIK